MYRYLAIALLVLTSNIATAQSLSSADPALTVLVRDQLIQHMPILLAETHESWGKQRPKRFAYHLTGRGVHA